MEREIVFIDTCVFDRNKHDKKSYVLRGLADLVNEGYISILLTEITKEEIRRHLRIECNKELESIKKCSKNLRLIRNTGYTLEVPDIDINKIADKILTDYITEAHIHVIGYDYCSDVKEVFDKYFSIQLPFSEKKQKEFPDAFAIQALENYAKKAQIRKIVVLSTDSDFGKYTSPILEAHDPQKYVSDKLTEKGKLAQLLMEFDCLPNLQTVIDDHAFEIIDQDKEFYCRDPYSNTCIDSADISNLTIVPILSTKQVLEYSDDYIVIQLKSKAELQIDFNYSCYDNAIHDSEDDMWYGAEEGTGTVDSDGIVIVDIRCEVLADQTIGEISIIDYDYSALDNVEIMLQEREY